jgi:putative ABC transport system ATP-binding protein
MSVAAPARQVAWRLFLSAARRAGLRACRVAGSRLRAARRARAPAPVLPYRTSYNKVRRAEELLAQVGLAGRERALPSRLSGGEQQRVGIARALIGSPHLLLADEPTGNLDSATGDDILKLLLLLRQEHGMTIIIATHDAKLASAADQHIGLHDGQIAEDPGQFSGGPVMD